MATDEKKLEYTKYLLKQLEQKQTDYSQESIARVASNISYFSNSIEVSRYILNYSFDRCYRKKIYNMCLRVYGSYKIVYPEVRDLTLRIAVSNLQLLNTKKNIKSFNSFYKRLRENRTDREIEEKVKEIYKNIDTDIPEEVMFYYKKFLNDK